MNTKKLSLLAVLALSSNVLRADIVDLNYTKNDLASVERTASIVGTCKKVYALFAEDTDMPTGHVATALDVTAKVGDFTDAALEGDHAVNRIGRIADACKDAKDKINKLTKKVSLKEWTGKEYAKMSSALVAVLAEELAQGFVIKQIKKNFGEGDQKQRLYRRAMYVGKDLVLNSLLAVVNALLDNKIYETKYTVNAAKGDAGAVEGKDNNGNGNGIWTKATDSLWEVAKAKACSSLVTSLARQIIGEILISNADDDAAAPVVLRTDKMINSMC